MIVSFRDGDTELLWKTGKSRRIPADLRRSAWKKLAILNAVVALDNLRVPPGNRLEALTRDRDGQHSIRVNDQYRVCFRWLDGMRTMSRSWITTEEGRCPTRLQYIPGRFC